MPYTLEEAERVAAQLLRSDGWPNEANPPPPAGAASRRVPRGKVAGNLLDMFKRKGVDACPFPPCANL